MRRHFGKISVNVFVGVIIFLALVIAVFAIIKFDVTGENGSGLGKEFVYDIKGLDKVDPNLIIFEETAAVIETGFNASHGIALDGEGKIYVAGDKAVRKLSENGNLLGEIKLADRPGCLTVGGDGKIYVGLTDHVEVYENNGKQLVIWQSLGERAVITSIAVSGEDVFVADAGNRIVLRFDSSGELINRIGKKDQARNISGFIIPSPYFDIAIGRDGLLRVVNPGRHRIEAYTFDGDLEFWWGKASVRVEGFCGCCNPVNFAILKDESFVTCEKGLVRIKVYDPEGKFVGVVAGPEQLAKGWEANICGVPAECQSGGFDIAVDNNDRVFVLDTVKNVVRIFSRIKRK